MSSRAELKQKAKNLLDGRKGKAALMVLIYYIIPFLLTLKKTPSYAGGKKNL